MTHPHIHRLVPARCARACLLALLALVVQSGPTPRAQEPTPDSPFPLNLPESKEPDVGNGRALAGKLCISCHAVEDGRDSVHSDIPAFKSIANRPGQTQEKLANWLIETHPPMPNLSLTREEVRDIGGYLLSLRDAK